MNLLFRLIIMLLVDGTFPQIDFAHNFRITLGLKFLQVIIDVFL